MRFVIAILLIAIVVSLGSALFQMMSKRGDPQKMTRALTVRVALSAVLVVVLILSWQFGWLQ